MTSLSIAFIVRRCHPYVESLLTLIMLTASSHPSHTLDLTLLSFSPPPHLPHLTHTVVYQLLKAGGRELLDELCLSKQCQLGENIVTQGHDLPTTRRLCVCVCVGGGGGGGDVWIMMCREVKSSS